MATIVFHPLDNDANIGDTTGVDVPATIRKMNEMYENALRREFPEHEISVQPGNGMKSFSLYDCDAGMDESMLTLEIGVVLERAYSQMETCVVML